MTNRREFLQTTAAIAGSLLLPKSVFATPDHRFHFIHVDSCKHWPIADPVKWSLENAHEPIFARAAEGLSKLTTSDGDRIIRLVVRRCSLNLLEVHPGRVVVDHWGSHRTDLRPFFKTHGLARPEIEVVVRDRKKETITTLTGDSFFTASRSFLISTLNSSRANGRGDFQMSQMMGWLLPRHLALPGMACQTVLSLGRR